MKKLVLHLIKKYYIESPKFTPGVLVRHVYGDAIYETVGTYYTPDLRPVLFVRDSQDKLAAVDQTMFEEYRKLARV